MTTEGKSNKGVKIAFWIFTILLCIGLLISSIPDLMGQKEAMGYITGLGYPAYMVPFISIAKLLAVVAIIVPGFPRIKEWAYAGVFFDFTGAAFSQIANHVPLNMVSFMLIWYVVLFGSYIFYHKKLKSA